VPAAVPAAPEACHFVTPVRFGRRKTDQVGHLVMSTSWLKFQGRVDLSVSWADVERVENSGVDVIVSLHDTRRLLRFCCAADEEAARGSTVARHLAAIAQSDPLQAV
jgi:hypothetical protein